MTNPLREISRISPEALAGLFDRGQPVTVLDVREPEDFFSSPLTILGAIAIPPDEVAKHVRELSGKLPIVVFDSSPGNSTSIRVAFELLSFAFVDVRVLVGGFTAWEAGDYPTMPH